MRNIFRYKQRMFMTLFGVAGSIAAALRRFRNSIFVSNLNQQQFEDIIHYDMIVANNQIRQVLWMRNSLNSSIAKDVKEYLNVHFETLQKLPVATRTLKKSQPLFNDRDDKLVDSYVSLHDRDRNKTLKLSNDGAIISEKWQNS